ncbi:hypothetical protein BCR43DRAFT_481711 [Syncephalastrum racemosum]|uniref:N-acetyltransferase domain-containing protein n=1 Tax=Syncephalastrum racemosum TaxID=13706 RepID=A0A1X2HSJ7_SYNRA|nr:hypothetical protein BCR43DRAFT_481711 [Syncephalastrum racemosum]
MFVNGLCLGATKEAAHTLTEAYAGDPLLNWCRGPKYEEFLYTLFKNMVHSTSLQSRDFAVQVEGCKGVLVWTNQPQGCPWPHVLNTAKLASYIGWTATIRALMKFQPACDKVRRRVMANYPHYITIGYVGVLPHEQRKGLGSALIEHVTDRADAAHHPIYVQVNDAKAIRFFEKFGFQVKATVNVTGRKQDLPVSLMVREPVVTGDVSEPRPLRLRPGRQHSNYSG